jgi:hypothetical protein
MTNEKSDDKKFNETLKRMLETPPKPHDKGDKSPKDRKPTKDDDGAQ